MNRIKINGTNKNLKIQLNSNKVNRANFGKLQVYWIRLSMIMIRYGKCVKITAALSVGAEWSPMSSIPSE